MKAKKQKRVKVFNATAIKTQIAAAVDCDLTPPVQVQGRECSSTMMLRDRQRSDLCKKFSDDRESEDLAELTYMKFLFVNLHMKEFDLEGLNLPDHSCTKPQTRYDDRINALLVARGLIASVLTNFTDDEWYRCCKNGTGSSIGVVYKDTSLEAKSKFPISITSRAVPILDDYLLYDSQLYSAMLNFNKANPLADRYVLVEGSRATTVPKSNVIRRMIAVEPTGNMFLQQGLMALMYRRMKQVRLDVERLPTAHMERARISSITSKEATIDWSSASDCVSIELLRWLLPPKWFDCLDRVRSPFIFIQGEKVELNMFSTMGNAGTFPLETLVLWALGHGVRQHRIGTLSVFPEWDDLLKVSVYGDDCIVPSDMAEEFVELCTSVGFIINSKKSYWDDKGFRESCGGDYYRGYNVRPFSLKAPTSNRQSALEPWLYIIANGILRKYLYIFGSTTYMYDKEFFRVFFSLCNDAKIAVKLVPHYYPDDAGLKVSFDISRFRRHYDFKLSRLACSDQGLYTFLYRKFKYNLREDRVEELHYATWVKTPSPGEKSPWWQERRNGGYVVARGYSSCWSLPLM